MASSVDVLAVCHQAGAAQALLPVISALHARGRRLGAVFDGGATGALERLARDTVERPEQSTAWTLLEECRPKVVLAGTSVGENLERSVVGAALAAAIPVVCVLDSWLNYRGRFATSAGPWTLLPDLLAVPDETARADLAGLGFPPARLALTGQPHLDALARPVGPAERDGARERCGLGPTESAVLFVSEPHARDERITSGVTETSALGMLADVIGGRGRPGERLLVRPHPTEDPSALASILAAAGVPGRLVGDVDPRTAVTAADAVVGLRSMLLVEAAAMGAFVVSIRPAPGREGDEFIGSRLGLCRTVDGRDALAEALSTGSWGIDPERGTRVRDRLGIDGGAARRVADLVVSRLEAPR